MRTEQLEHILVLAKCSSMSQAAKKLFINQSSLSISIAGLENELGAKLFNRTSRGVTPTALGQEVIVFAERMLTEWNGLKQQACGENARKSMVISACPVFCNAIMLELLTTFKADYPWINITVQEKRPDIVLEQVKNGEAFIGLALYEQQQEATIYRLAAKAHLLVQKLMEDRFGLYVSKNHPLASQQQVTKAQLLDYPLVSFGEYLDNPQVADLYQFKNIYGLGDRESIKKMVAENEAISIFPRLMEYGDHYIADGIIVLVDVVDMDEKMAYYLIYRGDTALTPVEQALVNAIETLCQKIAHQYASS